MQYLNKDIPSFLLSRIDFWGSLEKIIFALGIKLLIASSVIFIEDDSVRSTLTVNAPAGSALEGSLGDEKGFDFILETRELLKS